LKLKQLSRSLYLVGLGMSVAASAAAQTDAAATAPAMAKRLDRVEVTGSSIKRIRDEGVLPIQVITASELERQGITSAEQMLEQLGMNAAGADNAISNNNVFGGDTDRLTGGSASANLRGLGPGSTLVLLNGRRVSTHGMSGGAVDLNAIPMAAVERVEVLKDGASAIYGTDAIGGVINFILKKNLQGVSVGANYTQPLESGGGTTRRATITGGVGSLEQHGVNLLFSLAVDRNDILRGSSRSWADGFQPEIGLSPNSSSSPFANIINAANSALPAAGSTVGATDPVKYTRINQLSLPGQAGCDAVPTMVQFQPALWTASNASAATKAANIASGRYLCNTDYGAQYMLAAPKEARNMVMRATAKLAEDHFAFFEWTGSRTAVKSELTPTQFSTTAAAGNFYPVNGPHYLNLKNLGVNNFDPTQPIAYRWRMQDYGNRVIENVSTNNRVLVGVEGDIGSYSYKVGLSDASSEGTADLIDGYAYAAKLNAALKTGIINPFVKPGEKQSQAAMDLIESTKARGLMQGGKTGLTQFDATVSGEFFKLPAGSLDFAVGMDMRRETYEFAGGSAFSCVSTLATTVATDVLLCPGNSAVPLVTRNVNAVFAELAVPIIKGLDMQLAVRRDDYSVIGSTVNPKIGLRFAPIEQLVVRGSFNTGFRAPSFQQQQKSNDPREYTGKFDDPVKCPSDPTQCQIIGMDYTSSGNPDLKPETSKQGTFGIVFAPLKDLMVYADYWRVDLEDRIRTLAIADVVNNYALFPDRFIRDAKGNIEVVRAGWINASNSSTKGLDWGANYLMKTELGQFAASINGTHMLSHKERPLEILPMTELVGSFGTRTLYLKDKFNATLTWTRGDWSSTVNANYKSGYKDQDLSGRNTPPAGSVADIPAYTTFGLFGTYKGFKNASITMGLRNLFDKQPPSTHHDVDDVVGAGWDPRVADPFGRTFTLGLKYDFK
jgi:iron complex outermembrane receptor protein